MPDRSLPLEARLQSATEAIRRRMDSPPRVGLILGSGLGDFADTLPHRLEIPTSEVPHYPAATVEGHRGRLVFIDIPQHLRAHHRRLGPRSLAAPAPAGMAAEPPVRALVFQGRIHFYESNDLASVLFPIRIAHELGVRILIVTNAAGGINRQLSPGDLMVITDHINLTGERTSDYLPELRRVHGPLYDLELVELVQQVAREAGIPLRRGVYAGMKGPSYETAAEVEMVHRVGGDAVGMSTVLEVHLAAALGMRVVGISCITNKATGIGTHPLTHAEVTEVAAQVRERFAQLLAQTLSALPA